MNRKIVCLSLRWVAATSLRRVLARGRHASSAVVALGLLFVLPAHVWADASIDTASGSVSTVTHLNDGVFQGCECSQSAPFQAPNLIGSNTTDPSSNMAMCQSCQVTVNGSTESVGPAQANGAYSGDAHFVSWHASGSGTSGQPGLGTSASADASGFIHFTVTGQPTAIPISVSFDFPGRGLSASVTLNDGAGNVLGMIEKFGTDPQQGSLPSAPLAPGDYQLSFFVGGTAGGNSNPLTFSYSMDLSVSAGGSAAPLHWVNPAGGAFQDAANWNPAQVPRPSDTALFDLADAPPIVLAAQNTSVARLFNDGMIMELDGSLSVVTVGFGVDQAGQLTLGNGTTLTTQDGVVSGSPGGLLSSLSVSGAGTQWTVGTSAGVSIGTDLGLGQVAVDNNGILNSQAFVELGVNGGAGTLLVESGGLVETPDCIVDQGNVLVRGVGTAPSKLSTSENLSIAGGSVTSGSLVIEAGGQVLAEKVVTVGSGDSTGVGTVTISGTAADNLPSGLIIPGSSSRLTVSGDPGTQIEVTNGALLETSGPANIGSGIDPGKVLVHLASPSLPALHSTWDATDIIVSSGTLTSELNIEAGGVVNASSSVIIAGPEFDLGHVGVADSGSFLSADLLIVGIDGSGELVISGAAQVQSATGKVGSPGLVGSGAGFGSVTISAGTSLQSSTAWHVTGNCDVGLDEPGKVFLLASGPFSFSGADLIVDGTLTVGAKGAVVGNGTLTPGQKVVNGGFISPGLSPGGIMIQGDYEQSSTALLRMEAAGLDAGMFDVLHVTGDATLAGTLEVLFLSGYLPKTGDSFTFLQVDGTLSGQFDQITFPQLAPGFQFDTVVTSAGLQLTALNDALLAPTALVNISTRAQVGTDANVLIGGFIIQGTDPKKVMVRAIGPSLGAAGVSGALADPTLELHDGSGAVIGTNDNWTVTQIGGVITADQAGEILDSSIAPTDLAESALIATLPPGEYTVVIRGANNAAGVGLAEVYDLSLNVPTKLANISTRGFVETADNVLIGGFIIGNQTTKVIARAIGPSLADAGVTGALADPTLELHDTQGVLLVGNDNWKDTQQAEIEATTIPPSNDLEAAIVVTLAPGNYTAVVRGKNDTTGVALVEVFNLP